MTDRSRIQLSDGSYLRSTGASSAKFGPCEICGLHVSEVFMRGGARGQWTFGHETCLRGHPAAVEEPSS